jgi:hypothetical protein
MKDKSKTKSFDHDVLLLACAGHQAIRSAFYPSLSRLPPAAKVRIGAGHTYGSRRYDRIIAFRIQWFATANGKSIVRKHCG